MNKFNLSDIKDISSIDQLAKHNTRLMSFAVAKAQSMGFNKEDGENALQDAYIRMDAYLTKNKGKVIGGGLVSFEIRNNLIKSVRNVSRFDLDKQDILKSRFDEFNDVDEDAEKEILMNEITKRSNELGIGEHIDFILECFKTNVSKACYSFGYGQSTGLRLYHNVINKLKEGKSKLDLLNESNIDEFNNNYNE